MRIYLSIAAIFIMPFFLLATEKRVKVLLIDGFSNHNWQLNTALIKQILEPSGLFEVTVSTAPSTSGGSGWEEWRPDFQAYDVVLQTCNDINGGPKWPLAVQQEFEAYIRGGGGVFIYHSANNAFADWEAYSRIIGIGWRKADQGTALAVTDRGAIKRIPVGEGKGTGHGPRVDAVITRLGDHPIHSGLPRKWKTPDMEIYYYPRGPAAAIEVLSYAYDVQTGMNWPVEWMVKYGAGTAYSATFGHVWHDDDQPERMRCAAVQTLMIRALYWLATKKDDLPVPVDFPTENTISLRPDFK